MSQGSVPSGLETSHQRFERILSQAQFAGLKAILDRVSPDRNSLYAWVKDANGYEELLARLGYRLVLTRQIHVQDCYSRLGAEGGIKAVLPYYDIPTQGSMPTLVNFDATVTTTPKGAAFFTSLLTDLRKQLAGAN